MTEPDRIRLRHIVDACDAARHFIAGKDRRDLDNDLEIVFALLHAITIIGEAGANVSDELRKRHPEVPWPAIVAMRNRLVHGYFDVNLDRVWETATVDTPKLSEQAKWILATDEPS